MMEVQQPSVPRTCTRQSTFPNAAPQPQALPYPPRQMSLPARPEQDGALSHKPLTTSQHHPPKINLLNRSPAVNLSSPTPTDSSSQPSSAEDVRSTSLPSFSDESLSSGIIPKPSIEDEEALSTARPPLSTDSSFDYKDSSGIDLHEFIVKTLRENPRDRLMLLKLEKDFTGFIRDETRVVYKYQQMTSYHRMLVHRVAAYFGLDHNVDQTGKCVIVNKTHSTRIPECSFKMYCSQEYTDEEISQLPRAILKRANSLEDCATPPRSRSPMSTPKTLEDKKSRSIEEREHDYEKARARIFKDSISSHSSIDSGDVVSNTSVVVSPRETEINSETIRQASVPPRFQDWSEQRNAEREAAIAAAAAATGGNIKLKKKWPSYDQGSHELPQRQDLVHGHGMSSMQSVYPSDMQMAGHGIMSAGVPMPSQGVYINVGQDGIYSPGSMWINPMTGQPLAGHDPSSVIYPHGYTPARQGGVIYQAQQAPHPAPHQTPYPYVMPVHYAGGPQQHYYVVNHPQGERTQLPHVQSGASPHPVGPPSSAVGYQDISSQMAALSLSNRHADSAEEDVASTDSYSTTPTPPPGNHMDASYQMMVPGGNPYMIIPQRQIVPGHVYQNPVPLQYVGNQGYSPYSPYTQYIAMSDVAPRYPPSHTPPVQPRSPSPVMVGQPYVTNPQHMQAHMNHPGRVQTPPYTRTPPPTSSPFIRNTTPMPGGTVIFPVPNSVSSVGPVLPGSSPIPTTSSYQNWKSHSSKRSSKGTNGVGHDALHYQALAQEGHRMQQNIASISNQPGQSVKMVHMPPHFPILPGQRFQQQQSPYNHFMSHPTSVYKRGKPKTQSRTPRQNVVTTSIDDDKKTVNHILEVYDMPDGLSPSETDALLKDLEDAGGHILRINNSSTGSSQNAAGPTVLAIFKSATEAQSALETVNSPKFKLRVSQKSPTHFSADSNSASRSNSTSSS